MEVFNHLLKHSAVLTARNSTGTTPLQMACRFGRVAMVRALVEAGVPLDDKDDYGDEAIHYAAKTGCKDAIQMLVDRGINMCTPGITCGY